MRTENYELTSLQQTIICGAMADYSNKVENKLDRLRTKETFTIGFGETIPAESEREKTFKILKVCLETMKILKCG